jgi:glycosyltransferase involved in cell wall biosynthesis
MSRLSVPSWVKKHSQLPDDPDRVSTSDWERVRAGLARFAVEKPEVSIVIPAYNEEKDLFRTLSSLSECTSRRAVELIVANNNSTDRTQEILDRLGVKSVFARDQGISYARQAGLEAARGTYIMSADSDSIYPAGWVDALTDALVEPGIAVVYGRYSFIPSEGSGRLGLSLHEIAAEQVFSMRKQERESVNVMGFNFGYIREQGLQVGGFNHNLQRHITRRSEDGWMALCLYDLGKIRLVRSPDARVWTSDRRLMADGNLFKAFSNRVVRIVRSAVKA